MSSSFHLLEMSNNIYLEVIFLGFSHIPHVSGYRLRRALRLRHHTLRMLHNYVVRSHSHEEGRRWERCIFIQERGKEDLYEWGGNASTKAKERQREEIQNIQVICTTAVQCLSLLLYTVDICTMTFWSLMQDWITKRTSRNCFSKMAAAAGWAGWGLGLGIGGGRKSQANEQKFSLTRFL